MHEREWRIKGDLALDPIPSIGVWWWPLVRSIKDAQTIFREFEGIHSIYVMELNKVLQRHEIFI